MYWIASTVDRCHLLTAGAHLKFTLVLPNGEELKRAYSIVSEESDTSSYVIGVLREPNSRGGSSYIHDALCVGSLVEVESPVNNFPLVFAAKKTSAYRRGDRDHSSFVVLIII